MRTRANIFYVAVIAAALTVMCIFMTTLSARNIYRGKEADLFARAHIISGSVSRAGDDMEYAGDILSKSLYGSGIRGIITDSAGEAVYDTNSAAAADGIILASSVIFDALSGSESALVRKNETGIKTLSVAVPISGDGIVSGTVFLSEDMAETDRLIKGIRDGLIAFSLIFIILIAFLSYRMSSSVISPLNDFISAVQEFSKGNFSKKIPVQGNSEIDQLANAINYMSTELELLESKRRKFVSDASHELKTPMATIKLICDSITASDNPDPAMVQEFLSDLSDEVDRLTRIIEKLLLLTKLDSKETDITPELVDVGMMIQRIKNNLTPIAAGKNITISSDIPADMPPVMLDYDRIWESMYNIVENAVKYSKIGTVVKITAVIADRILTVKILDSGKGIPDEFKERVFERFYRLDDSRTRETGGTGLGLAIAKEAILLHGGTIHVEDNPEGGSCFVMTLPAGNDTATSGNGGEEV